MELNLTVSIKSDGFRLEDESGELPHGVPLCVRYELLSGWISKDLEFEPDPPTLFHPFRKAMFIYTGDKPLRVLVEIGSQGLGGPSGTRRFASYPALDDSTWADDDYRTYFSSPEFTPDLNPGGGHSGGGGASGDFSAPAQPTQASEVEASQFQSSAAAAAEFGASESSGNETISGAGQSGMSESTGPEDVMAAEPNAY